MDGIGNRVAPARFLAFLAVLLSVSALMVPRVGMASGVLLGFDAAAAFFLLLTAPLLRQHDPADIRSHAAANDANRPMLLVVTAITMLAILAAIFELLGSAISNDRRVLIIISLLLAWLFSNSVYALHYAHLHYGKGGDGGLDFSGKEDPDYADFVYFSFTLGMTFQTSDTEVTTRRMRRAVTLHCLAGFIFNLGVIAFTINVLGQS